MRRYLLAFALLLAACASPAPKASVAVAPQRGDLPSVQEPPEVKDPNFILVVSESVPNPDDDGVAFTKVFVDGREMRHLQGLDTTIPIDATVDVFPPAAGG